MIRIGDFSRLSRVSVKTLRYYDEMRLLKPVYVDALTGYRFYEYDQLPRLNRILVLKDLGFSLEEIGRLFTEDPPAERLRQIMRLRREEARKRMQEEAMRLERVDRLLDQIEKESEMSKYDVVIKKVEPLKVAGVRGIVPTPPQQGPLWSELYGHLEAQKARLTGPCLALYYDEEYREKDWDIEACQPIAGEVTETAKVKVRTLPAVESMACTVHHGSLASIQQAYDALMKWVDASGYRICGPGREVYLRAASHSDQGNGVTVSQEDTDAITELQYPVERTS
jgi:effector-binding domain-containing protein